MVDEHRQGLMLYVLLSLLIGQSIAMVVLALLGQFLYAGVVFGSEFPVSRMLRIVVRYYFCPSPCGDSPDGSP